VSADRAVTTAAVNRARAIAQSGQPVRNKEALWGDHKKAIQRAIRLETNRYVREQKHQPSLVEVWFELHGNDLLVFAHASNDRANNAGTTYQYYWEPVRVKAPKNPLAAERRRTRRNAWFSERRKTDPQFALNVRLRSQMWRALGEQKRGRRWEAIVGYTVDELRAHLEARFVDGMSWENMGEWHIDHIRPLASFVFDGPDCPNVKRAWALSNLQPLWAQDNARKGARYAP
jgi:hypothetical protein